MNKPTVLAIALALVCVGPGLGFAQGSDDRPRARLVLSSGDTMDVRGPVLRQDGLVVFFTEDGMRTSIQERLVRRVQELDAARDNRSSGAARPSATTTRPRGEFTNQDLPISALPPDEDQATEPVPLQPRTVDPGAFGNDDLPMTDPAPTDEAQLSTTVVPTRAPAGALTNENLPRPAEAASDGTFTNVHLPDSTEAPATDTTPQSPTPVSASPNTGALTNADLPAQPTAAPEQPPAAASTSTPPGPGAFSNEDLPESTDAADAEDDRSAEQDKAEQAEPDGNGGD